MSSPFRKVQKNASKYEMDKIYQSMTPEMYRAGIRRAAANAAKEVSEEYDRQIEKMHEEYNKAIHEAIVVAMDTLSIEILYELGRVLNCYVDEPEYLDQKIELVQNIYQSAMDSIKDYASNKYKNDNQAQRAYKKKKKLIEKVFGIYGGK